jgi:hypothetical protein
MPKIRGVNPLENPGEDHVKNPGSKFLCGSCFLNYLLCYFFLVPLYLYFFLLKIMLPSAKFATVLGSIPAFSDPVESKGRQKEQR